jgi:hypothetical protein
MLTRRHVLAGLGIGAGAVLLGACGDDGSSADVSAGPAAGEGSDGDDPVGGPELALAQFFGGPLFAAGTESRAPFGLADRDGLLPAEDTPTSLAVTLLDDDDVELGPPVEVTRFSEGLPRGYYPLRFTVGAAGIYTARTEVEGVPAEMRLQVHDDDDLVLIRSGQALPELDTPTVDDARGVDPICTRDPVCDLHDLTVAEALGERRPMALLVATPAFCQIAICGPVLDVLLDVGADHPDIRFLHAEVFADPYTDTNQQAPVVQALGLHFEPVLILTGADGIVAERIDVIYDRTELDEALTRLETA